MLDVHTVYLGLKRRLVSKAMSSNKARKNIQYQGRVLQGLRDIRLKVWKYINFFFSHQCTTTEYHNRNDHSFTITPFCPLQ